MRERAKRLEMHTAAVEGPRTSHGETQKESLVSDVEQDTCTSADQPLGDVSLMDWTMETLGAEIAPREVQSQVGEMTLTAGDHELKVVARVGSTKGQAPVQEREVEPPSKRRKQESDLEPQVTVNCSLSLSLCDDSSDHGAKSVSESAELDVSNRSQGEREGELSTKLDEVMLETRDVNSELLQVRELVGHLVSRERCAETKAETATRRH